jgi:hypothetical protein
MRQLQTYVTMLPRLCNDSREGMGRHSAGAAQLEQPSLSLMTALHRRRILPLASARFDPCLTEPKFRLERCAFPCWLRDRV